MGNFVHKDPRGYLVVLFSHAWDHAEDHHGDLGGNFMRVTRVLTDPGLIMDNPPIAGVTRTAQERYIQHAPDLGGYIVVPSKIIAVSQPVKGYGNVGPETRIATTAHISAKLPPGSVVWRKI